MRTEQTQQPAEFREHAAICEERVPPLKIEPLEIQTWIEELLPRKREALQRMLVT